jgi:hypothetical protein
MTHLGASGLTHFGPRETCGQHGCWTGQVTRDLDPDRTFLDSLEADRDLDGERLLAEYRTEQRS